MRIDGPIYSVTHGTGFWDDIAAWMSTDFYRYNPAHSATSMDYPTYHAGRVAGTIPAPDAAIVAHNIMHPVMQADFSLDKRDDDK